MPVQFIQPSRQQEKEAPEESTLDKILKGLQVAGQVTGIATNVSTIMSQMDQRDKLQQDTEFDKQDRADEAARITTQGKIADKVKQGGGFRMLGADATPEESASALEYKVKTENPGEFQTVKLLPTQAAAKEIKAAERQKYQDPNGNFRSGVLDPKTNKVLMAPDDPIVEAKKEKEGKDPALVLQGRAKDFGMQQTTKDTNALISAHNKIKVLTDKFNKEGTLSPEEQTNLIYAMAQIRDPGGRVTDGDFKASGNVPGVVEYVQSLFAKKKGNLLLDPTQMKAFESASNAALAGQLKTQKDFNDNFKAEAAQIYGVDASQIPSLKYYDKLFEEMNAPKQNANNGSYKNSLKTTAEAPTKPELQAAINKYQTMEDGPAKDAFLQGIKKAYKSYEIENAMGKNTPTSKPNATSLKRLGVLGG